MLGKFMDWCLEQDKDGGCIGMLSFIFGMTFATVLVSIILAGTVYNLSGARDRDIAERKLCQEKGGKMIYVKGTGDVCIKGVIELEEVK